MEEGFETLYSQGVFLADDNFELDLLLEKKHQRLLPSETIFSQKPHLEIGRNASTKQFIFYDVLYVLTPLYVLI